MSHSEAVRPDICRIAKLCDQGHLRSKLLGNIVLGGDDMKVGDEYMPTDKQYNGQLIEEYQRLDRVLKVAEKEQAIETIAIIKEEMRYIKLKLQPIELPVNETE